MRKAFTLIELLVVVAIIAILAAIAIPQYNKYRSNAMLSNVQRLTKSISGQAEYLATVAGQNPAGRDLSDFCVKIYKDNNKNIYLAAYPYNGTDCNTNNMLDKILLFKEGKKPNWVDDVDINGSKISNPDGGKLILSIGGTGVSFNGGYVGVKSTYKIGTNAKLGCKYYPDTDNLTDYDNTHYCRTNI